ncbi:hypothetical protein Q1695_011396 [Nippostrongylus brasiliensis]|nr:hypothetical protein Q1695_011396 [Nippostrongylus brasiliensis]
MLSANKTSEIPESCRQTPHSKMIMIAGGGAGRATYVADVNIYDPYNQQWIPAAPLLQPRCDFGMATVGDSIYAVGGLGPRPFYALRSVEIYDSQTNRWRAGPEMKRVRCCLGVAALDRIIFAVGGEDNSQAGCTAEMLDPRVGNWMYLRSMSKCRTELALAASNGYLYAVGGRNERHTFKSVEVYDLRARRWTTAQPMPNRHRHGCATVFRDQIVIIGGFQKGKGVLRSAKMLTDDGWMSLPEMSVRREGLGVVNVDGSLFAFGGRDGSRSLSCIEYLGLDSDQWEMSQACFPCPFVLFFSSLGLRM